jgi:hypothetical protein
MISRRSPASSSFVLAAARLRALQLDPWPRGGRTRQLRGRIQENSQPSPAARVVTGPDPYALLTVVALMGAAGSAIRCHGSDAGGSVRPASDTVCCMARFPRFSGITRGSPASLRILYLCPLAGNIRGRRLPRSGDAVVSGVHQCRGAGPPADPRRGHRQVRRFVGQIRSWLPGLHARSETVASTAAGGRAAVELLARLTRDGRTWPDRWRWSPNPATTGRWRSAPTAAKP